MEKTERTICYYDENAEVFANETLHADMSFAYKRFLRAVKPPPATILDLGCGSGRDTLFFQNKGFSVDAIDGSPRMCEEAHRQTGIDVNCMLFSELDAVDEYDSIWACASLLHVPAKELKEDILPGVIRALKQGGILYVSVKYGEGEQYENGRFFCRWKEDSFHELTEAEPLEIIDEWVSEDVRPDRSGEKWLNVILRKGSVDGK